MTASTLVILNPTSGRGHAARLKDKLVRALDDANLSYELVETKRPGDAVSLAQNARREGFRTAVAAGGDGTISEVVNGLMHDRVASDWATPVLTDDSEHTRLGLLPVGSGNDFATMLGIPLNLDRAARLLATGNTRLIDIGTATISSTTQRIQRFFDNNMGIGLEGSVMIESYKIKRMRGSALYVFAAIKALMKQKSPVMRVQWLDVDGTQHTHEEPMLMVSIGNSARAGGGFYLTPSALLDDSILDLAMARDLPRLNVMALLPKALFGKHTNHHAVTMGRFTNLMTTIPTGAPVQLDGELVMKDAIEVEIGILPQSLHVIA